MVTTLDISEVRELVELRRELEGYAGFLAAGRITEAQLKRLRTLIREAEKGNTGQPSVSTISDYFDTRFSRSPLPGRGEPEAGQNSSGSAHRHAQNLVSMWASTPSPFPGRRPTSTGCWRPWKREIPTGPRAAMEAHVDFYAAEVKEKFL